MADPNWTQTRAALSRLNTFQAAALLPKLLFKGPGLIGAAKELSAQYPFSDDRFKIRMIHVLRQELPEFEDLYQALLADLMADKPRLPG